MVHPADNGPPADEPALRPAAAPATARSPDRDPPPDLRRSGSGHGRSGSGHGRSGSDRARPISDSEVAARLIVEFEGTHGPEMVSRCVSAARKGAEAVMGSGTPDLVERVARKHLQVLAIVAAERRGQMTLRPAP